MCKNKLTLRQILLADIKLEGDVTFRIISMMIHASDIQKIKQGKFIKGESYDEII